MDDTKLMSRWQLLFYFLRLGLTGFGGPLAIVSQMQIDLVEKKKVIDAEEFRKSLALVKAMPGSFTVQMVAYTAYRLHGILTAVVAATLFILPAALMMAVLASYYEQIQTSLLMTDFIFGMKLAAIALIVFALYGFAKPNFRLIRFWSLFLFSILALRFFGWLESFVILCAGLFSVLSNLKMTSMRAQAWIPADLFWICFKAGALTFGSGFAIIPLLQTDFVGAFHWVTKEQFMDAIAFGQLTPGPIAVTVTFVGYRAAGGLGASLATMGIFLPGVLNMTTWFPRTVAWISKQKWIKDFVVGATSAVAAGILLAVIGLFGHLKLPQMALPIALILIVCRWRWPSWLVIVTGGAIWSILQHLITST